ncbi:MAG: SUF system NifU family Fe-S cluster assembly protein [Betaproteobacteria bacterium]|nr:SUF system NifU family Fe-S cluster assembly protein [Betaproteobacteria bacterium]MDE1955035.1 SUF system NifU family Fe-S cluster assembly protein [Betaproteobacteria bacterium]MDE2153359.1 SUF system NifU family Fe-S cluster assembly protein [Betaproteobacteria bacterium]MDE2477833.1 SUF system NifU family Fe-S cluster assembly protein [Betaproteobacteria bacterium]
MNDELSLLYQDVVLDHKRHPRHYGPLPDATCESHGHNPLCGDTITLRLRTRDQRIEDIAFEGQGCAICMASASLMTEAVHGARLVDARVALRAMHRMLTLDGEVDEPVLGKLALLQGVRRFPSRIKCAALAWHALGKCLGEPAAGTQEREQGDEAGRA